MLGRVRGLLRGPREGGVVPVPHPGGELPGDNSGETAPPAAAEALRELALFRSLDQIGEGTFLVDTATNEAIHYRVEVDEGVISGLRRSAWRSLIAISSSST